MQSNTQVRGIHQSCIMHAQGNNGRFPDDIGTLLLERMFVVQYVISPLSGKTVPPQFKTWSDDAKRRWVNENASYVLMPGLTNDHDTNRIALFTKIQDSGGRGISICWNDNHVTFVPMQQAKQIILEKTGKTLEQWSYPKVVQQEE